MLLVFSTRLWISGISLFPFIFIKRKYKNDVVLLNHEKIHILQQLELLVIPFYMWYLLDYFVNRLKGKSHRAAYRDNIFEKEAYRHETDLLYPAQRKFFGFLRTG